MEYTRSISLDSALKEYQIHKTAYKAIEDEWASKEKWLKTLPPSLFFPVTILLDFGVDIRHIKKIDEEKEERKARLHRARERLTSSLSFEPGNYDFVELEFCPTLRNPGTFITVFEYPLEDEVLNVPRYSSKVLIEKHHELDMNKVEIVPLSPPIIQIPKYYLNMKLHDEIRVLDARHTHCLSVNDFISESV